MIVRPGPLGLTCLAAVSALTLCVATSSAQAAPGQGVAASSDLLRWRQEAKRVSIVRDDWGIAHVHGATDADAVFGMAYAQAEDDFNRVETNYITNLGRLAEAEGEGAIWQDLRQRLFIDPEVLKADYAQSPGWLRSLMDAWAGGLNFYLATHPQVHPRVITWFEPWMALSFTEGSIGGDIERASLKDLQAFYDKPAAPPPARVADAVRPQSSGLAPFKEPGGSNGIAIAPSNTLDHHALLLINPHTSFFFRSELQMTSDEGLNAYGAVTWGQFFIYQGFNAHVGWMHTSSGVDVVDEFVETIVQHGGRFYYRYGAEERPVQVSKIVIAYHTAAGAVASRTFTTYATHHGPVVRTANGKWVSLALMNKPVEALSQSYLRTKTVDYASFLKIADTYKANSSNNTIFADDKGEIAYLHPQFIPRRDDRFDYTQPVDGANPATDWKDLTALSDIPHVLDPPNGWIMNTNDWPYSAADGYSPRLQDFPRYMDTFGENPRGDHATRLLRGRKDFSLQRLNQAAFDPFQPAFAKLIPTLVAAYDQTPASDPLTAKLKEQMAALRGWDDRWSADSVPTTLAVFWGDALWDLSAEPAKAAKVSVYDWMADHTTPAEKLNSLAEASDRLVRNFGDWRTPWGEINRFQRLNDDIAPSFSDAEPSLPVPFTSSRWGSLASFGAQSYPGTKEWYGTSGNSFVAVVEFGPTVRAVAVTAGGESGHPDSPHFKDEAQRYSTGQLREVYFYPKQLAEHTQRQYQPGQ